MQCPVLAQAFAQAFAYNSIYPYPVWLKHLLIRLKRHPLSHPRVAVVMAQGAAPVFVWRPRPAETKTAAEATLWQCAWCGKGYSTRYDVQPVAHQVAVADVVEQRLRKGLQGGKQASARRCYRFCNEGCAAQASWPEFSVDALQDLARFASVRNKVTILRSCGQDSVSAMETVEANASCREEKEWCQALLHGYNDKQCSHIYSIQYYRDPAIQLWLDGMEKDLILHRYAQATLSLMFMAARCNRKMAIALNSTLRTDKQLPAKEVETLLEEGGSMASATRLGNESVLNARQSLVRLYMDISRANEYEQLEAWWATILSGGAEMIAAVQRTFRKRFPLPGLGDFKVYFVAKCLRHRFVSIRMRSLVGSNLKPDREMGAFQMLFTSRLAHNLGRADLDASMGHITESFRQELVTIGEHALSALLDTEIIEHCLCEWVKARRVFLSWRSAVVRVARPLQRRETTE